MKIYYTCEICGFSSGKQSDVERCEGKGRRNAFAQENRVLFIHKAADGTRTEHEGVIVAIEFKPKTHAITYQIFSEKEQRKYRAQEELIKEKIP